jgi:NTP pyrophosphatase (non-canonical NTP hydrolase)
MIRSGHDMEKPQVNYGEFVAAILKPGADIQASLTASDCNIIHMGMLLSTESAELLDAIKKATIYRKPWDMVNVLEELGDAEFALEAIRQHFGLTRQQVLEANVGKLSKRYAKGKYSNEQAINRADKVQHDNGAGRDAAAQPCTRPDECSQ